MSLGYSTDKRIGGEGKLSDICLWFVLMSFATVVIFITALWLVLHLMNGKTRLALEEHLRTALAATVQGLSLWHEEKRTNAIVWAGDPPTREAILLLIRKAESLKPFSAEAILRSEELRTLRRRMEPVVRQYDYAGFVVFDAEGRAVGSLLDQAVGNNVLAENADFITRSLQGETVIAPAVPAEIDLPPVANGHKIFSAMTGFISTPVYSEEGQIAAVLAFRIRPEKEFTRFLKAGRFGNTGETYAFDASARMLSPSRFAVDLLRVAGEYFSAAGAEAEGYFELRDPGGNLMNGYHPAAPRAQWPLTHAMMSALGGKSGVDIDGNYRDYRGVTVAGAWIWLKELGLGVATKIDMEEALAPVEMLHPRNFAFFFVVLGLSALSTYSLYRRKYALEQSQRDENSAKEGWDIAESVVNNSKNGIFALDRAGRIVLWNPVMEQFSGLRREEVVGRLFCQAGLAERLAECCPEEALREAWRGEKCVIAGQEFSHPLGGGVFVCEGYVAPIRGRHQQVEGVLGIWSDVTERKKAELELQQAHAAAVQGERAKSEFLSIMSHELRTPLNAVLGMGQLLEASKLDATQQEYIRILLNSGELLLSIISEILDFSKLETGNMVIDPSPFDLFPLIEGLSQTLGLRAREKDIELVFFVDRKVPNRLVGDAYWLRRLLSNLVANAIKFTEQGEVVVRIEKNPERFEAGALRFSISDTGIGVPPEKLHTIFAPFTQADSSSSRRHGGMGLGLAICNKVVQLMGGGGIDVQSQPGVGSRFSFSLMFPVRVSPAEWPVEIAPSLGGKKILVVDDNATNREILGQMLADWGIESAEAGDGTTALALLEQSAKEGNHHDLILLDNKMPGMSGLELMSALRREKKFRNPPAILLCSDLTQEDIPRMHALGIERWMLKPVRRTELYDALVAVFNKAVERKNALLDAASASAESEVAILVAEDSPDNRVVLGHFLKNPSWRVDFAENGEIAVRKFAQNRYDLIVLDMQMPVMDGHAAARGIRQIEIARNQRRTPIVALTAFANPRDIEAGHTSGCDHHLSKPVKKAELLSLLSRYLPEGNSSLRGENGNIS